MDWMLIVNTSKQQLYYTRYLVGKNISPHTKSCTFIEGPRVLEGLAHGPTHFAQALVQT